MKRTRARRFVDVALLADTATHSALQWQCSDMCRFRACFAVASQHPAARGLCCAADTEGASSSARQRVEQAHNYAQQLDTAQPRQYGRPRAQPRRAPSWCAPWRKVAASSRRRASVRICLAQIMLADAIRRPRGRSQLPNLHPHVYGPSCKPQYSGADLNSCIVAK